MTRQTTTQPAAVSINVLQASEHADWQRLYAGYNRFYERELPQATYERMWGR